MCLSEIKTAIEQLSFEERAELAAWLHGWNDDEWDEQMKRDVAGASSMTCCVKWRTTLKRDAFAKCREVANASAFLARVQSTTSSRPMSRARKVSTLVA